MKRFGKGKMLFNVQGSVFGTAMLEFSKHGKVLKANNAFYEIIGCTKEKFKEKYESSLINMMTAEEYRYACEKARRQLESFSNINLEISLKKDEGTAYLYVAGQLTKSVFGKKRLWCIFADISYSKMANKQLLQINMDLDRFVSNLPGGAYRFSYGGNGEFDFVSRGLYELFSGDGHEFREKTENRYENLMLPEDRHRIKEETERQLIAHATYDVEYRILTNTGEYRWVSDRAQMVSDNSGSLWICGFITDITHTKKQEKELEISREKYHIVSDLLEDILFDYNIGEDTITFSNRFLEHFDCSDVVRDYVEFIHTSPVLSDDCRILLSEQFEKIKNGALKCSVELLLRERGNDYKWYHMQLVSIRDDSGKPLGAVGKLTSIHEQKKELERLTKRANLDALTGLYNKCAVKEKIEKKLTEARTAGRKCALMMIDIDNFKAINDFKGHLFGDAILTELSAGLAEGFSDKAILGRVGGDEFVVFFDTVSSAAALETRAKKVCSILSTIRMEETAKSISGSVGIAVFPEHGNTYEELFQNADIALYCAKNKGKNRFEFYDSEIRSPSESVVSALCHETNRLCSALGITPHLEFSMLNYLFVSTTASGCIRQAVKGLLEKIGSYYQFDRVCIFRKIPQEEDNLELVYEWHIEAAPSLFERHRILHFTDLEAYLRLFDDEGIYESRKLSEMPVSDGFKEALRQGEKDTVLHFASYEDGELAGIILAVKGSTVKVREEDEKKTLLILNRLIVEYISKITLHSSVVKQNRFYTALAEQKGLCNYVIHPASMSLISFDKKTKELFPDAEIGKLCYECFFGRTEQCKACPAKELANKNTASFELFNEHLGAWLSITAFKTTQPDGDIAYSLHCFNISKMMERIKTRDELTGLLSVSAFTANAETLLKSFPDKNYAFVSMDIIKFKYINETEGTSVGDQILISIAGVLSSIYYYDELVCRSNADKFLLLLRYEDRRHLERRLSFIHQKLTGLQQKEYSNIKITVVSGVYLVEQGRSNISIMVDKASIARKEIKNSIKNDYFIYNDTLHNLLTKEKDIEIKMQSALDNREFVVHLQPKTDLSFGTICGAEALVRWKTREGAVIPPGEFVPLFEKNGFVIEMDFYVYEEIFKTLRHWLDKELPIVPISVNVSRLHLSSKDFLVKIQDLISRYLIPPGLIELELTESIFINYDDALLDIIKQLKATGFYISIDDFGSGYSSLNLLKNLPVDIIKLDKSFFSEDFILEKEKIVVSNIIRLAKELNLRVIAEGVESKEQADYLRTAGCDMVQGYYCGHAVTISEFEALLKKMPVLAEK